MTTLKSSERSASHRRYASASKIEQFVIGHRAVHQKVKNIRRDARVALSLLGDQNNALGLREYLVVYGGARISEGGRREASAGVIAPLCLVLRTLTFRRPALDMRDIPRYIRRITPARFARTWAVGFSNLTSRKIITLRKASERGRTRFEWLDSRHTFSFADYYDPLENGYSVLRVINDDRVAGGGGFPTHPRRDIEIITYVLEGVVEHRDSLGTRSVIPAGGRQRLVRVRPSTLATM